MAIIQNVIIDDTPRSVYWEPKEDITVYELAVALGALLPAINGSGLSAEYLVMNLPPEGQRHFRMEGD
jgi:hypothetical protein